MVNLLAIRLDFQLRRSISFGYAGLARPLGDCGYTLCNPKRLYSSCLHAWSFKVVYIAKLSYTKHGRRRATTWSLIDRYLLSTRIVLYGKQRFGFARAVIIRKRSPAKSETEWSEERADWILLTHRATARDVQARVESLPQ